MKRRWIVFAGTGLVLAAYAACASPPLRADAVLPARPPPELETALARFPDRDAVAFEFPGKGRALWLGANVGAPVEKVRALLRDPAAFRRAVPAFVRADEIHGKTASPQRIAWELEVPLWNLKGELSLTTTAEGAVIEMRAGDLVPGRFSLHAVAAPGLGKTKLFINGTANLRGANWMTRRVAARHPQGETAMVVTAAYVLLRGLALEAAGAASVRQPKSEPQAPPLSALDGAALGQLVAAGQRQLILATVRSNEIGRLDRVEVAVPTPRAVAELGKTVFEAAAWKTLPGWSAVEIQPTPAAARGALFAWTVTGSLPFVDFDAQWAVFGGTRFRALALQDGDWSGAVMGWDLASVSATGGAVAVLSLNPRLDRSGYIPRRLVGAEPLLEHGLAVGLAFADAVSFLGLPSK